MEYNLVALLGSLETSTDVYNRKSLNIEISEFNISLLKIKLLILFKQNIEKKMNFQNSSRIFLCSIYSYIILLALWRVKEEPTFLA